MILSNFIYGLRESVKIYIDPYTLIFKKPSATSRGIFTEKKIWLLKSHQTKAMGECAPLIGLSVDYCDDYEVKLTEVCTLFNNRDVDKCITMLQTMPSALFAFETFLLDAISGGYQTIFGSDFEFENKPININGLVWMGDKEDMQMQITQKINEGYKCIKIKIGAIDFDAELSLLKNIRQNFSATDIEIRVDANGAFAPEEALQKLEKLSKYNLHSIEQPIHPHQLDAMQRLCATTPLPIALDEELIQPKLSKTELLEFIKPQYIVIKPNLVGGFGQSRQWIAAAEAQNIPFWITSALESNVGLNAIAQFASICYTPLPHGLGTGQLFTNNFDVDFSLNIKDGKLYHHFA